MVLLKSLLLIIDFFIFYTIISEVVVEYKKQKREVLHMKKFAMSILAICILLTPVSALGLPILPIEADRITTAVQRKGLSILGGKNSPAYKDRTIRSNVYNKLHANLRWNFGVKSFKAIRRKQCDKAIEVINRWDPPVFLAEEIEKLNNK